MVVVRFLVIRDDASLADICVAIRQLRRKQQRMVIPSTYDEVGADIDELLEMPAMAEAAGLTSPGGAVAPMDPGTPAVGRGHGAGRDASDSSGSTL